MNVQTLISYTSFNDESGELFHNAIVMSGVTKTKIFLESSRNPVY